MSMVRVVHMTSQQSKSRTVHGYMQLKSVTKAAHIDINREAIELVSCPGGLIIAHEQGSIQAGFKLPMQH